MFLLIASRWTREKHDQWHILGCWICFYITTKLTLFTWPHPGIQPITRKYMSSKTVTLSTVHFRRLLTLPRRCNMVVVEDIEGRNKAWSWIKEKDKAMSWTSMGMDTFSCGAVTGLSVWGYMCLYMPGSRSDLARGKAATLACVTVTREAEWFSCWKERKVCVQLQAMSISVLFIFRHAVNLWKLRYYLKFECTCSLWPHHFLFTGVSWGKHKCAMACLRSSLLRRIWGTYVSFIL